LYCHGQNVDPLVHAGLANRLCAQQAAEDCPSSAIKVED